MDQREAELIKQALASLVPAGFELVVGPVPHAPTRWAVTGPDDFALEYPWQFLELRLDALGSALRRALAGARPSSPPAPAPASPLILPRR